jgi:hypothetical protein
MKYDMTSPENHIGLARECPAHSVENIELVIASWGFLAVLD